MGKERRQHQRISFDAPVKLAQGDLHALSEVIDVSLKGILIKGDHLPFDLTKPVRIQIQLGTSIQVELEAECAHESEDSYGFHITHIDIESMSHLRRLLELNTGDESLLDRELSMLSA